MAFLSEASKEKEFDVRMVERNLAKGLVLKKELDKHLKDVTDDQANADFISIETFLEEVKEANGKRS